MALLYQIALVEIKTFGHGKIGSISEVIRINDFSKSTYDVLSRSHRNRLLLGYRIPKEIVSYLDIEFQRKSAPTNTGNWLQYGYWNPARNRLQIGYWNPANFIIFFAGKSALNCTRILQEIGSKLDTGIPQILLFFLQGNQLQIVLESCRNRLRFGYQSHRKLAPKLEYRIPGKSAKSPRSGFRRTGKPIDKFRSSILKVHGFLRGISKHRNLKPGLGFRLSGFCLSGWNFEGFWLPGRHFEGPEHQRNWL
ncbi:unnamed protein product [Rhizophagus irregularis]|nr:unnamed protein product [Rhizophagus irregularis]